MQLASGWTTVLRTDFWGTPIGSLRSHGSYRPLTVLTLWLNRQLDASGTAHSFHAANVVLHGLVTWLLLFGLAAGMCFLCAHIRPRIDDNVLRVPCCRCCVCLYRSSASHAPRVQLIARFCFWTSPPSRSSQSFSSASRNGGRHEEPRPKAERDDVPR